MKWLPGFTDFFMSPVTGRIILSALPSLPEDYVWIGDRNNKPVASPIIIDLQLEIIDLKSRLSETHFILQTASEDFYNSQALDQLPDGILRHEHGIVKIAFLPTGEIWIGNSNNNPVASPTIQLNNLPDLPFRDIWRGDIFGRPQISSSLTDVEFALATLQFELGALQTELGIIQGEVSILQGEVIALQGQVLLLEGTVAGILTTLGFLQQQIDNTNTRIDNLRLNNIPIDGDVDFHGYRLKGLPCDPIFDSEPTTLCFIWHLMHDEVNILWP